MAGWLGRLTPRRRTGLCIGVLLAIVALPLRGLLMRQGPPMEEGFMLVFAERFLHGDIPNKDFLHLYGPAGIWVLAGAFKIFGVSLLTERMVALAQLLGIIFGIFFLARPWGRTIALTGAVITALIIIPPIGLADLAWNGAVALSLFGLVAGAHATRAETARARSALSITSGALFGVAILYRPDLVVAIGLVLLFLLRALDRRARARLVLALGATLSLFLVQIAMAGLHNSIQGMIIDPLFNLRGGRHLPIPPNWSHFDGFLIATGDQVAVRWPIPRLPSPAQLTMWFFLLLGSLALLTATARHVRRREPAELRGLVLMMVAVFSIGILPQAVQRSDTTHMAWVSCVPFGFLPAAGVELVRWRGRPLSWLRTLAYGMVPVLAVLYLVVPNFMVRDYADMSLQTFNIHRKSYKLEFNGRVFYYGRKSVPEELSKLLPVANRIARPGDKLVVGTGDLRKTPYSDAFIYFMLPKTRPGTYYIEMDPGVANAKGSRLASDIAHSQLVILSRVWDNWVEPNDTRVLGSDAPNKVLASKFCKVLNLPTYELLERCDVMKERGNSPAQ